MTSDVLGLRSLNRATLARQLLLEREDRGILDTVAHLVGLQAQVPLNPYTALWSRLRGFDPAELGQLLLDRAVVRIVVMRGTIHLVTADDCLLLRPLVQPVLDQEIARHPDYKHILESADIPTVLDAVRPLLAERPRTQPELRAMIAERFPDDDPAALAYACRNFLAYVQVPPRGVWGQTSQVTGTTAEAWLGRPLVKKPSIDAVVRRYFAAFGPSTVADVTTWCRLTGMREVVERLRPTLRVFHDEGGRELFDIPDAPRPDPDTPAPVRFLPEYDNVLLSHADRSRFQSPTLRTKAFSADRTIQGTVLHDGVVVATWRQATDKGTGATTMTVDHAARLTTKATAAIAAEGRRLLRFLAPDATERAVEVVPLPD